MAEHGIGGAGSGCSPDDLSPMFIACSNGCESAYGSESSGGAS